MRISHDESEKRRFQLEVANAYLLERDKLDTEQLARKNRRATDRIAMLTKKMKTLTDSQRRDQESNEKRLQAQWSTISKVLHKQKRPNLLTVVKETRAINCIL